MVGGSAWGLMDGLCLAIVSGEGMVMIKSRCT